MFLAKIFTMVMSQKKFDMTPAEIFTASDVLACRAAEAPVQN
jgi:hypothetical protein